jgi:hypothetical protein
MQIRGNRQMTKTEATINKCVSVKAHSWSVMHGVVHVRGSSIVNWHLNFGKDAYMA